MNTKILPARKSASVRALCRIKDVTPADARAIRESWRTIPNRSDARAAVDRILRTFGVEYLGVHRRSGERVYYCNAGDTYATTVCFIGPRMVVCCWGGVFGPPPADPRGRPMTRRRDRAPFNRADLILRWVARFAILAVFAIAAAGLHSTVAN